MLKNKFTEWIFHRTKMAILLITACHSPAICGNLVSFNPGLTCTWEFGERQGFSLGVGAGFSYLQTNSGFTATVTPAVLYNFKVQKIRVQLEGSVGWWILNMGAGITLENTGSCPVSPYWLVSLGLVESIAYYRYCDSKTHGIKVNLAYPVLLLVDMKDVDVDFNMNLGQK